MGESDHSLNLRDGDCYCPYAKFDKKGLLQSRARAGCDVRPPTHPKGEEDEEEEEEDDEDDEAGEADVNQVEFDAQGLPVIPANIQLANAAAADLATKRLATHARRLLSQALTSLGPNRSTLTQSCGGQPLRAVDMVGLWYKVKHQFYGLCVHCANLTTVTQPKIGPLGLDCGRCDDKKRRLCIDPAFAPPRHPLILDHKVACAACRAMYVTNMVVRVYDEAYHTYELPLCRIHLGAISKLGPVMTIGVRNAPMVYPLPLAETLDALAAYDVRTAWASAQKAARALKVEAPPLALAAPVLAVDDLMARKGELPPQQAAAVELVFFAHCVRGQPLTDADRATLAHASSLLS